MRIVLDTNVLIVTGDKDLLDLKSALGIPIIAPSQFWEFESK